MSIPRLSRIIIPILVVILIPSACAKRPDSISPQPPTVVSPIPTPTSKPMQTTPPQFSQSKLSRELSPAVSTEDQSKLVGDNLAFALDLYHKLAAQPGNLFYSPYSISEAMAMVYGGASGQTAQQMSHGMNFNLPQDRLHPAFNSLDLELATRAETVKDAGQGFQLNLANATWGQSGFPFLPSYLDLLAKNYGAGMHTVDFANQPEDARQAINEWVSQQTQDKIKDIVPQGAIDPLTRLVLANAIYFKASWLFPFNQSATQDAPFYKLDGSQTNVSMMSLDKQGLEYSRGEDYQAVSLPYVDGNVAMLLLVPDAGMFSQFESGLDAAKFQSILNSLQYTDIELKMPRFTVESSFSLAEPFAQMGMTDAFDPSLADFSGMDGQRDLFISSVLHKAYASVDESGTEAAAATVVMMSLTAIMPNEPVQLTIDHPFIFVIYDQPTQTILFVGRMVEPGN